MPSTPETGWLAAQIEIVRYGLQEAAVMADVAQHEGDDPPFSSGYDDVHDACNAIWQAKRAISRLDTAITTAIKEAEARGIERAVGIADSEETGCTGEDEWDSGYRQACMNIAERLRSLSQDQTAGGKEGK